MAVSSPATIARSGSGSESDNDRGCSGRTELATFAAEDAAEHAAHHLVGRVAGHTLGDGLHHAVILPAARAGAAEEELAHHAHETTALRGWLARGCGAGKRTRLAGG